MLQNECRVTLNSGRFADIPNETLKTMLLALLLRANFTGEFNAIVTDVKVGKKASMEQWLDVNAIHVEKVFSDFVVRIKAKDSEKVWECRLRPSHSNDDLKQMEKFYARLKHASDSLNVKVLEKIKKGTHLQEGDGRFESTRLFLLLLESSEAHDVSRAKYEAYFEKLLKVPVNNQQTKGTDSPYELPEKIQSLEQNLSAMTETCKKAEQQSETLEQKLIELDDALKGAQEQVQALEKKLEAEKKAQDVLLGDKKKLEDDLTQALREKEEVIKQQKSENEVLRRIHEHLKLKMVTVTEFVKLQGKSKKSSDKIASLNQTLNGCDQEEEKIFKVLRKMFGR